MRSIKSLVLLLFCFLFTKASVGQIEKSKSQNIASVVKINNEESSHFNEILNDFFKKRHFTFHFFDKNIDTLAYYKAALNFHSFHPYRFFDKRRVIFFNDKKVSVELYSAQEIKNLYGKDVRGFIEKDNDKYPRIEFVFYNGRIKEQLAN